MHNDAGLRRFKAGELYDSDRPGDFADLSLVAIAERLGYCDVVSLDADFDVYRRYGKEPFNQLFPKYKNSKTKRKS